METQERESKSISPYLPNTEYKYLKLWHETLDLKDTLGDYYISLHNKIEASDFAELTIKESAILKEILKSRIINKGNLYDYFINFDKVVNKPSFFDKLKGKKQDAKYERIVAATDTPEDTDLKKERLRVFKLSNTIYKSFDKGNFLDADEYFKNDPTLVDLPTYEKIKASYVKEYFAVTFQLNGNPFLLDDQQSEAICNMGKIALLNSRAGTGKTRVIMAKALFLLNKEDVSPESICLLSFDRKHTEKLKATLTEIEPKADVLDFDTLLSKITGKTVKDIDEEKESIVLDLLEKQKKSSPEFIKNLFDFYSNDNVKIDKKSFRNVETYYNCLRNSRFQSLRGEYVNSLGKKWVADFLYQNKIEYQYKKPYYISKIVTEDRTIAELVQRGTKVIYPDFYLPKYNILIEHSRINENEPDERVKVEFEKINGETWGHYRIRMQWKRDFWDIWRKDLPTGAQDKSQDETIPEIEDIKNVERMVETSEEEMLEGHEKFEAYLKGLLEKYGVKCNKMDHKELIENLWELNKNDFAKLVTSFSDRYLCSAIKDEKEFAKKTELLKDFPNITQFYEIGLKTNSMKDFETSQSQLILDAIKLVEQGKADKVIKQLKWILVDDFQDFTQGYYLLISEIIKQNPEIKIFLAGDNWQTLHRTSGTDSIFIEKAVEYFPEVRTKDVSTNYRCKGSITQNSNKLMKRNAVPGMPAQSYDQDYARSVFIDDVTRERLANEEIDKSIVLTDIRAKANGHVLTKYLYKCIEKIKENKESNILLVHRSESIYGMPISEFLDELSKSLVMSGVYTNAQEVQNHIDFSIMSDLKPLETDVIIFLQITSDVIPSINSSSALFEAFGENILTNLTDQLRLFYVAMTRAKSKIYIFTEKDKESEFLEYLK
jgi:DNA helicase-4